MKKSDNKKADAKITEEYLTTVSGEMELSIVEGLLRSEDIPMILRNMGAGNVFSSYNFSNFGVDIYVSSEDLERAKEVIQKNGAAGPPEETGDGK
jgi:hypothetical protein